MQYEYDGWGNLTHFHQDVDSAMSSPGTSASGRSAFTVQHDLTKSAPSGGVHALRRTATYSKAGGTTFHQAGYAYGSATINDLASRVASVTVGSSPTTVATYDYLGAGHLVGTTLDQANLNTSVFTESGGTHTYTDLDKFNRPTRWNWERVGGASGGFYNTAIAYDENSNPVRTTDDAHARNNSSDHPFDVVYGVDSLNRVISADEGNIASGAIESGTRTRKELWNSLSLTGNWGNRQLDANGDGDYGDEADRDEPSAYNTFNKANEWTARRVAKAGGSDRDEHAYTYDAFGNLTDLAMTAYRGGNTALTHRRLVYDAFGRLVRVAAVEGMDETDVAVYRYNGLNMRLMWQDDADADSTLESGERFYVMHDERWRPVATFRDTDTTPKEAFVWHAAGLFGGAGFQPASYIDSIILRDRDNYTGGTPNGMTSASDGTLEERRYYCQNWRADVVAVTKSDGTPLEYVRYSAYGEPTVYPVADLNMDGVVNSTDSSLWSDLLYSTSNVSVYADSDLDFDGLDDWNSGGADGDLFYESYNANLGLSGVGRVSSPGVDSRTGYAGYQWDQTAGAYHVRYRVYLPDIGRWTRRDPLGYTDGQSLYSYVASRSLSLRDPSGLFPPLGSLPVVLLKSLDCEQRLDQSLERWRQSLGNAPDVLLSAISITAMQEYSSLSLTDRGAIGVFHTTQVCILGELHGCASASGSYSPADAQWIVDVTIAFMRPYLSSLCQRARGAPVFDPGWGDLWRRIDTGDLGTKLIPPTSREFEIARQAALNHINNDLSAALLKHGRGSNAVWACIGAAVDKCQKRTIGGMNLGADVAGACFERFDVGAIRDKMRDRIP